MTVDVIEDLLVSHLQLVPTLYRLMRRFLRSDEGPTAVEYAVMLALIIIVCLSTIKTLGTNAKTTFSNAASSIGT